MKDLLPLRRGGADAFERALLDAGRGESPSDQARKRLWSALGTTTALVGMSKVAEAAADAAAPLGQAGLAPPGGSTLMLSLGKWAAIAGVAGGVVVGAVAAARHGSNPELAAPAANTVTSNVAPPPVPPPSPAVEVAEPVATVLPAESARPVPSRLRSRQHKPASNEDGILREVRILEQAKASLAQGDTERSAALLAQHRRFAQHMLGPEADILAIELAQARGDSVRAARLARAFLSAHPRSPHARRVRSLLEQAESSAR